MSEILKGVRVGGGPGDCRNCELNYVLSDRYREALGDVSFLVTSCGCPVSLPAPTKTGCPVSPQVPCLMSGLSDIAAGSELGSYRDFSCA